MNSPNAANIMFEAFRLNKLPKANLIKNGSSDLNTIKQSLKNQKVKCARSNCACAAKKDIITNKI